MEKKNKKNSEEKNVHNKEEVEALFRMKENGPKRLYLLMFLEYALLVLLILCENQLSFLVESIDLQPHYNPFERPHIHV